MSRPVKLTDPSDGPRFWITDSNGNESYGPNTVGIVDDEAGGVIAYCHEAEAARIILGLQLAEVSLAWNEE